MRKQAIATARLAVTRAAKKGLVDVRSESSDTKMVEEPRSASVQETPGRFMVHRYMRNASRERLREPTANRGRGRARTIYYHLATTLSRAKFRETSRSRDSTAITSAAANP
jgi:RNA processing factor Prp31